VPLSKVTGQQIVKLIHITISDKEMNFSSKQVASFCGKYKITYRFSLPYYSQDNGQSKISNRTILDNICKILGRTKGK